jgi:hypothetical protein
VILTVNIWLDAGKEEEAYRHAVGDQGAGQRRADPFGHDQARGLRLGFESQIVFQIVDDAGLAGSDNGFQAAPGQGRGVPRPKPHRAIAFMPVGANDLAVVFEQGQPDAVVGSTRSFADIVQDRPSVSPALARRRDPAAPGGGRALQAYPQVLRVRPTRPTRHIATADISWCPCAAVPHARRTAPHLHHGNGSYRVIITCLFQPIYNPRTRPMLCCNCIWGKINPKEGRKDAPDAVTRHKTRIILIRPGDAQRKLQPG